MLKKNSKYFSPSLEPIYLSLALRYYSFFYNHLFLGKHFKRFKMHSRSSTAIYFSCGKKKLIDQPQAVFLKEVGVPNVFLSKKEILVSKKSSFSYVLTSRIFPSQGTLSHTLKPVCHNNLLELKKRKLVKFLRILSCCQIMVKLSLLTFVPSLHHKRLIFISFLLLSKNV